MCDGNAGEKCLYAFDRENGLIRLKVRGSVTLAEIVTHTERVNRDPRFRPGLNTLVDVSDAIIGGGYTDARRFSAYVRSIEELRGACKWAVVAPGDLNSGLARMAGALLDGLQIQMCAFRGADEALAWLGFSAERGIDTGEQMGDCEHQPVSHP